MNEAVRDGNRAAAHCRSKVHSPSRSRRRLGRALRGTALRQGPARRNPSVETSLRQPVVGGCGQCSRHGRVRHPCPRAMKGEATLTDLRVEDKMKMQHAQRARQGAARRPAGLLSGRSTCRGSTSSRTTASIIKVRLLTCRASPSPTPAAPPALPACPTAQLACPSPARARTAGDGAAPR